MQLAAQVARGGGPEQWLQVLLETHCNQIHTSVQRESVRRAGKNLQKCRLFAAYPGIKGLNTILLLITYRWMSFIIHFLGLLWDNMTPIIIYFKYCYSLRLVLLHSCSILTDSQCCQSSFIGC